MTTPNISDRKMSVMEKHTPIAATARVSFRSRPRLSGARTLDGRLQADFLFGLVQKHHELGRGEKLALPHARQVRRNFTERFWGRFDDRTEH